MCRADLQALVPVRRHREGQAERAWHQARERLRECEAETAAARAHLQTARERQMAERAALGDAHRGRALSVVELNAWSTQERRLIGELAEHAQRVQALEAAQARQAQDTDAAQQRLSGRRRDLEKLKALMARLGQETGDE